MKAGSSSQRTAGIKQQCHFSISTWYTSLSAFFTRLKLPKGSRQDCSLVLQEQGLHGNSGSTRAVSPDCQPRKLRESSPRGNCACPLHTQPAQPQLGCNSLSGQRNTCRNSCLAFQRCLHKCQGNQFSPLCDWKAQIWLCSSSPLAGEDSSWQQLSPRQGNCLCCALFPGTHRDSGSAGKLPPHPSLVSGN